MEGGVWGGGHVDLQNFKSCRPFLAPDLHPELYSVLLEQMWVFVTLISWDFPCLSGFYDRMARDYHLF